MSEKIIEDNVRMVLSKDEIENKISSVEENSWEILNCSEMNSFVFPSFKKATSNNGIDDNWTPQEVDIAIVFQTISSANKDDVGGEEIPSFLKKNDYKGVTKDDPATETNEKLGVRFTPCGFITSRGSIMPMLIIPTENYIQNGLELNSISFKGGMYKPSNQSLSVPRRYGTCFNWVVKEGKDIGKGINNFREKGKLTNYGKRVETQGRFSFISSPEAQKEEQNYIVSRQYILEDTYNSNNGGYRYRLQPDLRGSGNEDISNESLIFGITNSPNYEDSCGGAFALAYNFTGAITDWDDSDSSLTSTSKKQPAIALNLGNPTTSVVIPHNGSIRVSIDNPNDKEDTITEGSISETKNSQRMGHLLEKKNFDGSMVICYPVWNGLAFTGGINDSSKLKDSKGTVNVTIDTGFIATVDNDANLVDYCDPTPSGFDTTKPSNIEVKSNSTNDEMKKKTSVKMTWGPSLTLTAYNCRPSFAYTPVFFQKNLKFSIFIKDNSKNNIISNTNSGFDIMATDVDRRHFLYPIFYQNNSGYNGIKDYVEGKKITKKITVNNETEEIVYYRFDFEISANTYQRRGVEIFGFYHQVSVNRKPNGAKNKNQIAPISIGDSNGFLKRFDESFSSYNNIGLSGDKYKWIEYATNININRSNVRTGGSITLDKYAMLGQYQIPDQPVGEIRLIAKGGNKKCYAKQSEEELYFSGLAVGLSFQNGSNSDTMQINLHGIEKKLEDIKLAGAPFFDGDTIGSILGYLAEYANFQYDFNNDFNSYELKTDGLKTDEYYTKSVTTPDIKKGGYMENDKANAPRSTDFKRPAINFVMGMTVFEALSLICEKTNKTFYINKEGTVVIVDQNVFGIPINIAHSLASKIPSMKIRSDQILNINIQPSMDNMYNQVVTASLKGKRKGGSIPTLMNTDDMIPNIFYDEIENNIGIPWSRIIVNNEMAILSKEEAKKIHEVNKSQFSCSTFSGGITIPGNSVLEIFDTIQIVESDGKTPIKINEGSNEDSPLFFITGISHNYESSTKMWTTSLQLTYLDNTFIQKAGDNWMSLTALEETKQ